MSQRNRSPFNQVQRAFALARFACAFFAALLIISLDVRADDDGSTTEQTRIKPLVTPADIDAPELIGVWEMIRPPTRNSQVRRLLVSSDNTVWIGTWNGLAYYDGANTRRPSFVNPDHATALIVNDMIELKDGSILLGTINGTLWRVTRKQIERLVDFGDQANFNFARRHDDSITIATNFGMRSAEDTETLRSAVAKLNGDFTIHQPAASRLIDVDGKLFAIGRSGSLGLWEPATGRTKTLSVFDGEALHIEHTVDDALLIATYEGCYRINMAALESPVQLVEGRCLAITQTAQGHLWMATESGVFRHDVSGWEQFFDERAVDINVVESLSTDQAGNLWVGGSQGLWRYFDQLFQIDLGSNTSRPTDVASSDNASNERVWVGMQNGTLWHYNHEERKATQIDIGAPLPKQNDSYMYFPGTLLSEGSDGSHWALNHNGLFKLDAVTGTAALTADYPGQPYQAPVTAIAIKDAESIYISRNDIHPILTLINGSWQPTNGPTDDLRQGMDVIYDSQGTLWSMVEHSVAAFADDKWEMFGPFELDSDAKLNFYGKLIEDRETNTIFANGPWGYPITLNQNLKNPSIKRYPINAESLKPYIFTDIAVHDKFGIVASASEGLIQWDHTSNQWQAFNIVDTRLASRLTDLAPAGDQSLWLVAEKLFRFQQPNVKPVLKLLEGPTPVIDTLATELQFETAGLAGSANDRLLSFSITPPLPNLINNQFTSRLRYGIADLTDGQSYRYNAIAKDAYGNTSERIGGEFKVRLPWYQNTLKLTIALLMAVLLLGLILTRRGPVHLLLRVFGGRRWRLTSSPAPLKIEISQPQPDRIHFRLSAPARQMTVEAESSESIDTTALSSLRQHYESALSALQKPDAAINSSLLKESLHTLGVDAYSLLNESVKFAYEQSDTTEIHLVVHDELMDIPWENWTGPSRSVLLESNAVARTLVSDTLATKPAINDSRIKAVLFAPTSDEHDNLRHASIELQRIHKQISAWGGRVEVIAPTADKHTVLAALETANIFHYIGHVYTDGPEAGESYIPLSDGRVSATDFNHVLSKSKTPLYLAFINGCNSVQEAKWSDQATVFGMATGFLKDAAYFVGAQWPVDDQYAAEFATAFYRELFPSNTNQLLSWLSKKDLQGVTLAMAVFKARQALDRHGDSAELTQRAYLCYGDPMARLVLN